MILNYDYDNSIIVLNKELTKDEFIERSKAGVGFSKNLFSRIYDSIYSELIDIRNEYEKYYSFEYPSFEAFLYKKLNLELDDIQELMELLTTNPKLTAFKTDANSYGDYQIIQFIFSDTFYPKLSKILTSIN